MDCGQSVPIDRDQCGAMTSMADRCTRAASGHAAATERGYQFPPSDGDWHVPLSVRGLPSNRNNSTPRARGLHVRERGDASGAPQLQ